MKTRSTIVAFCVLVSINVLGQVPAPDLTTKSAENEVGKTDVASDSVTVIGFDGAGRAVTSSGPLGTFAFRYPIGTSMDQFVDRFGSRVYQVRAADGIASVTADSPTISAWSENFAWDASGKTVLSGVDWESSSILPFAASLGIPLPFPDWLQISFNAPKQISSVKVYGLQDDYPNPVEPTPELRFKHYGLTDYEVQYWLDSPTVKKWIVVENGVIVGNLNVMRTIGFPPVTTTKVRVMVKNALEHYSRITEVEVFNTAGVNVALAQNGGTATASSVYPGFSPANTINGDRKGIGWGSTGGWNDATPDTVKLGAATVQDSVDAFNRTIVVQNPFAKVTRTINLTPPPTTLPPAGMPYIHGSEQTESMGKIFRAQLVKTNYGKEIWDNQGGSQWFGHDWANRMTWVADGYDYVMHILRDASGRPTHLYLGETAAIEFTYDEYGLKSKEFVDLRTQTSLYRVSRPSAERMRFPRTRQMLQAILPGHGPVAEFDKTVSDSGFVLASLFGQPYALIPFINNGPIYNWHMPVRWIITLYPEDAVHGLVDRIEYNENEIIVRMGTWREFPGTARHTVAFSLPRYLSSEKPITFKEDTSRTPNVPDMYVSVSDGLAKLAEPDNDNEGCTSVGCTITVEATPLPKLPYLPFYIPPVPLPRGGPSGPAGNTPQLNPYDPSLQGVALARTEQAQEDGVLKLMNKPECAALFHTLANKPGGGSVDPWETALNRILRITSGNGETNGQYTPCSDPNALMWMTQPRTSTIYVCPSVGYPDTSQTSVTNAFIHELLHAAGLFELPNHRATLSHGQITQRVNAACN